MKTDLHIHTQASDGTWTSEQVIKNVKEKGIGIFAVTDHDETDSLAECETLIHGTGLLFLPGVEVSSSLNGNRYHILAYGVDRSDQSLQELLKINQVKFEETGIENLDMLRNSGVIVDPAGFETYEYDPARGGFKLMNFLIDQGLCTNLVDLFTKVFNKERPMILAECPSAEEVIEIILEAYGIPILAHPGANGLFTIQQDMDRFMKAGIRGLECYSAYHTEDEIEYFLSWCEDHSLLITGGSDCHGDLVNSRNLGVPEIFIDELRLGELRERIVK